MLKNLKHEIKLLMSFSAKFSSQTAIANGTPQLSSTPITMSLRTFGNPTQSYLEFYIYGVMLMAAQLGICVAFSLSLHNDLKNHSKFSLPIKEVFYLCLSLLSVLIALILIYKGFDLPLCAKPWTKIMNNLFNGIIFIEINHINRKAHEHHMNAITRCN